MRSIKDELTLRRLDGARTDAPRCLKGKPCGDRCIPRDQECHENGSSPLREIDNRFKKLSRTEKLAVGGLGAIALTNVVGLPLLVKPTGRAIVEGAGEALGKNRKGVDDFIAKQSSTAASNAATSASETFNRLNKEGTFNETYQTMGSNIVEGGLSEKNLNNALKNFQKAANKRVAVQRRVNRMVANRDRKRVTRALNNIEPQFAKDFKKRLGIKSDSALRRRIDAALKCGPSSKTCGTVCIPRKYDCNAGTALAQKTKNTAKAVLGSKTFRVGAALGVAAALGSVGYNRLNKEAAEEQTRFWNAHRQAAGGYEQGTGWDKQSRSARREAGRSSGQALVKETLGLDVNRSYSKQEIRSAFKKWARKNHPDMGGDTARFQTLSGLIDDYYRDSLQDLFSFWARGFM